MSNKPKTLGDALARYINVRFVGIDGTVARALPVENIVSTWATEPFMGSPTWPVKDVPAPDYTERETPRVAYRLVSYLCTGWVVVVWEVIPDRMQDYCYIEARAYPRTSDEQYWPSEEECRLNVTTWARRLYDAMMEVVGQDCDTGPDICAAYHWTDAKRRYTVKNNQTCALLYCARLDPEGRHRPSSYPYHPMPEHIEQWVRYADFLCGVMAGVDPDEITADDMYASGGAIEADEILAWCKATWASGVNVSRKSS